MRVLRGHVGHVIAVAFSPNGKLLATGSTDGTGGLWRVADGFHIATLVGHTSAVTSVAFDPSGDYVATGSHDKTIRIWNTKAGMPFLVLHGHTDEVTGVQCTRGKPALDRQHRRNGAPLGPEPEPRMHLIGRAPVPKPKPEPSVAEAAGRRATVQGNIVVLRDLRTGRKPGYEVIRGPSPPSTSTTPANAS